MRVPVLGDWCTIREVLSRDRFGTYPYRIRELVDNGRLQQITIAAPNGITWTAVLITKEVLMDPPM